MVDISPLEIEVIKLVECIVIPMLYELVDHESLELIFIAGNEGISMGRSVILSTQPLVDIGSALLHLLLRIGIA